MRVFLINIIKKASGCVGHKYIKLIFLLGYVFKEYFYLKIKLLL